MISKKIGMGLSAAGLTAILSGGYAFLQKADERYTLKEVTQAVVLRITISELNDTYRTMLDEKYFLEKQLRANPNNQEIKRKLDEVNRRLRIIEDQLKDAEQQKVRG